MTVRQLYPIISIIAGLLLAVGAMEMFFRMLPVSEGLNRSPIDERNPIPRSEANREFLHSSDWNFSIVAKKRSNNYGFLNDSNYNKNESTPLLVIVGDSYVEAVQIENPLTMHGILSRKLGNTGRVYSLGKLGAPLSTYLVFADYAKTEFQATAMVFVIVGNDFDQSLYKYQKDSGNYYFFPETHCEPSKSNDCNLILKRVDYGPSPNRSLLKNSALIRYMFYNLRLTKTLRDARDILFGDRQPRVYIGNTPADASDERVSDSKRVVDQFLAELPLRTGLDPSSILLIVDGMRPSLYSDAGLKDAEGSYFDIMRKYLMLNAASRDYEVIDMEPIFVSRNRADGSRFEFETDGHWNALGHLLVAKAIEKSTVFSKTFKEETSLVK